MKYGLGALVGDYQGSVFEFHYTGNHDFDFDSNRCRLTDDSCMTMAVLDMIVNDRENLGDDKVVIKYFRKWAKRWPDVSHEFGSRFIKLVEGDIDHNSSYGNGAAMRISPVGWFATSEEEVKDLCRKITYPSHDDYRSYWAAETVAMLIFYANKGYTKQHLRKYAESRYKLFDSIGDIVKDNDYRSNTCGEAESCMRALPQALTAFFLTSSFDECLRAIVSSGGDSDTTAAIACSIAEAYYGGVGEEHEKRIMKALRYDEYAIELLYNIKKPE